jgi:hypothetical protein
MDVENVEHTREILESIRCHMDMMVDERVVAHCGIRAGDDLPMKVFRILQGYNKALEG